VTLEEKKQAARERSAKRHRKERKKKLAEVFERARAVALAVRRDMDERGMTAEAYDRLHEAQEGRCAICGTPDGGKKARLFVDHCHESGQVRGLLCSSCNSGLGFFQDNKTMLSRAIEYLDAPAQPWLYRPNFRQIRK